MTSQFSFLRRYWFDRGWRILCLYWRKRAPSVLLVAPPKFDWTSSRRNSLTLTGSYTCEEFPPRKRRPKTSTSMFSDGRSWHCMADWEIYRLNHNITVRSNKSQRENIDLFTPVHASSFDESLSGLIDVFHPRMQIQTADSVLSKENSCFDSRWYKQKISLLRIKAVTTFNRQLDLNISRSDFNGSKLRKRFPSSRSTSCKANRDEKWRQSGFTERQASSSCIAFSSKTAKM